AVIDNRVHLDGNNIDCVVTNHDSYAYPDAFIWPRGSSKIAVFAAGLWIGAKVDGVSGPVVKVGEYSQQWGPGPMVGDSSATDVPSYHVYKIVRGVTESEDYRTWPATLGAPVDSLGHPLV